MPRNVNPDTLGFLTTDISRMIRAEFDRRLASSGIGITGAEARVLANAARAGAVRQNVLADILGVEAMTLSGLLDRLEAAGLVCRQPDPSDRRAKLVTLTEGADVVLDHIDEVSRAVRADVGTDIAPDDWARLIDMLKRVRASLASQRGQSAQEPESK